MQRRAEVLASYIIDNNSTIRKTATVFNLSKSTVHNDVSNKLKYINKGLYIDVQKVLAINFKEKHIRGGASTKKLYEQLAKNKSKVV